MSYCSPQFAQIQRQCKYLTYILEHISFWYYNKNALITNKNKKHLHEMYIANKNVWFSSMNMKRVVIDANCGLFKYEYKWKMQSNITNRCNLWHQVFCFYHFYADKTFCINKLIVNFTPEDVIEAVMKVFDLRVYVYRRRLVKIKSKTG